MLGNPAITVLGAGGAGCTVVERMHSLNTAGAYLVCLDSDKLFLSQINDSVAKVLVGGRVIKGLGARGSIDLGQKALHSSKNSLKKIFLAPEMVFLVAGMGKGTGSSALPMAAEAAKKSNGFVVSLVSYPMELEQMQSFAAEDSIAELVKKGDSVIVVDLNTVVEIFPGLKTPQVYGIANELFAKTLKMLCETLSQPSFRQLGLESLKKVLSKKGVSVLAFGEATKKGNRVEALVQDALDNILFSADISTAQGLALVISSGRELSAEEIRGVAEKLGEKASVATTTFGARIDPALGEKTELVALFSGIKNPFRGGKLSENEQKNAVGVSKYAVRGKDGKIKKGMIEI